MDGGVAELVARQVRSAPDRLAVADFRGLALTYGQLWHRAGALAGELAAAGVGRGGTVLVALDRSSELAVALLAVVRARAGYVLLDASAPPAHLQAVAELTGARAVLEAADPAAAGAEVPAGAVPLRLTVPGPAAPEPRAGTGPDGPPPGPEDPVYVAFTSGSTGRPKGVLAPQRAVLTFVRDRRLCALGPGDRVAVVSSLTSDATTLEIWSTLAAGATVLVLPPPTTLAADDWPEVLERYRVTTLFLMTGLLDLVARERPDAFAPVRTLIFGGEAPNVPTIRQVCATAPPGRLVQGYGPTEATVFCAAYDCTTGSLAGRDWIPLGQPLDGYRVTVRDERLRPVPAGEVGELCVSGPAVALGYAGDPELTARRFPVTPDGPTYRSGDLVRRTPEGELRFVARADRQVKVRGHRVEPEEVERGVLATGLASAAVVEPVGAHGRVHLVCFVVPTEAVDGRPDLPVRLSAALAALLPGHMIPARWVPVAELPLGRNGKVDRARLRATVAAGTAGG